MLKSEPASGQIPVLMISGLDDGSARRRALDAGVHALIAKPLTRLELWHQVTECLAVHRRPSAADYAKE